jgi:hypothetical protein
MKVKSSILLLLISIILLCSDKVFAITENYDKNNLSVLVDLTEERLYLIDTYNNKILESYRIASGKESTPSPVGTWKIVSLGKWSDGFGSRWLGLNVPWGKYGIHGTNKPYSIGSEASHGCIRMLNRDIEELYKYMQYGTIVAIYAGPYGPFEKGLKTLIPGDRGSAVFEVQRIMKNKGYYPGYVDGVYGEGMKKFVLKFRKANKLKNTHDIDKEFYDKLGIELID